MNKKLSILGLILVIAILICPNRKTTNVKVNNLSYKEGNVKKAGDYLINKANGLDITSYNNGNKAEMYMFEHEKTEQTDALNDYRYIGANPNNYVYFNCQDANDPKTCEKWRIIGVFEVEDGKGNKEKRIKLIMDDQISTKEWNTSHDNNWSNSTINQYLNGEYYQSLSTVAQNMIDDTKYYLGGSDVYDNLSADAYYNFERSNVVYENHPTNWVGKVALMYPSDYVYTYALGVDDVCYSNGFYCRDNKKGLPDNGWLYNSLYQWTLSPSTKYNQYVFYVVADGYVDNHGILDTLSYGTRPVVYLKSDIYINGGDGSSDSPYMFTLSIPKDDDIIESGDKIPDEKEQINNNTNIDNNPQTYDNIKVYISLVIVSFVLIGFAVKKYLVK